MKTPIYVIAGQSNARNLSTNLSLEEALMDRGRDETIVKTSQGGTPLAADNRKNDWFPFDDNDPNTGELFNRLLQDVGNQVNASSNGFLKSFLWIQGEADTFSVAASKAYEKNLEKFVTEMRDEFGEDFNFTIVQLAESMPASRENPANWATVREAQKAVADKFDFITLLNSDQVLEDAGLKFSSSKRGGDPDTNGLQDRIHYNEAGTLAIAEAYLKQFGDNEVYGTDGNDGSLRGSNDADYIFGAAGDDTIRSGRGSDYVVGGDGNDKILAGSGNDNALGGAGNDKISGGNGNDTLGGGSGRDNLRGGSGNDVLFGGEGNDKLSGGRGDDQLTGGAGNDVFIFGKNTGSDTIFDFEDNRDKIDISRFDFSSTAEALSHATRTGNDVVFEFGDNSTLTINNTFISALSDDLII